MRIIKLIASIAFIAMLLAACGGKEEKQPVQTETKKEPEVVRVQAVTRGEFIQSINFYAHLSGIRETNAMSKVGGEIVKIHAGVGDRVEKDQVVIELPRDLPSVQYRQMQESLALADSTYRRMKRVYEGGGISKQELDQIETQLETARSQMDATRQMIDVRAPISGEIIRMNVSVSDNIDAKKPLFTVARLDKMRADVWVSEDEVREIETGDDAFILHEGKRFPGKVVQVSTAMEPAGFRVVMEFDNPEKVLKSGTRCEVGIVSYRNPEAIVIERKAVRRDNGNMYVFVEENGVAVQKKITNGRFSGTRMEVTGGLSVGDRLIVDGLNKFQEGDAIRTVE